MLLRAGWAVAVLSVLAASARADEMPVPVDLQAALFKKIFDFDRTLRARSEIRVVVLHGGAESELTRKVVDAFAAAGVRANTASSVELPKLMEEISVVYVSPGVDFAPLARLCEAHGVLSVSGIPELALRGDVAIGIGIREQKPEILVHLRRVKAEGHDLAAGLLEVAKVIR